MKRRAFTLIELLAVVAVIGILTVLIVPAFTSIGRAQALSTGAGALLDELVFARQTALAQNRIVEVRLYKRTEYPGISDSSTAKFRAFGTVIYDEQALNTRSLSTTQMLPAGIIILSDPKYSTLIEPYSKTVPSRAFGDEMLPEGKVSYQVIRFRPTGGTDLSPAGSPSDDKWFLSVGSETDPPADGKPGRNYVTLMLDPVSGRVRTFRP